MVSFDGSRVCGVHDNIGGESCLWPFADVSVFASGRVGQVGLSDAAELAIQAWNEICGINLTMTANQRTAHITLAPGSIDGPNGTLAWSELPCGFTVARWQQLKQKYDTGEMYVIADNPPGGKLDLARVMRHEFGHAIGIPHISSGNLLAPTYSATVRLPQRGDVLEAVARYGRRVETPTPPVVPTPDAPTPPTLPPDVSEIGIAISFGGKVWEGQLKRKG